MGFHGEFKRLIRCLQGMVLLMVLSIIEHPSTPINLWIKYRVLSLPMLIAPIHKQHRNINTVMRSGDSTNSVDSLHVWAILPTTNDDPSLVRSSVTFLMAISKVKLLTIFWKLDLIQSTFSRYSVLMRQLQQLDGCDKLRQQLRAVSHYAQGPLWLKLFNWDRACVNNKSII